MLHVDLFGNLRLVGILVVIIGFAFDFRFDVFVGFLICDFWFCVFLFVGLWLVWWFGFLVIVFVNLFWSFWV